VRKAEEAAAGLQRDALLWSDDILQQLERNLEKLVLSIKQNRDDLRNYRGPGGQ
jgi:hypothetical protein